MLGFFCCHGNGKGLGVEDVGYGYASCFFTIYDGFFAFSFFWSRWEGQSCRRRRLFLPACSVISVVERIDCCSFLRGCAVAVSGRDASMLALMLGMNFCGIIGPTVACLLLSPFTAAKFTFVIFRVRAPACSS